MPPNITDTTITKEFIHTNLIRKDGRLNNHKLSDIIKHTSTEQLYLIYNEVITPTCENNHNLVFQTFNKGYGNSCTDRQCTKDRAYSNRVQDSSNAVEKSRKTKLERHGNANYVNLEKRQETIRIRNEKNIQVKSSNIKNRELITKPYILSNFLITDNGFNCIDKEAFKKFFNCKGNFMNVKLKELGIVLCVKNTEKIKIPKTPEDLVCYQDSRGRISSVKLKKYRITSEELYCLYNSIDRPVCKCCSAEVSYRGFKNGFNETCSVKCANRLKEDRADKTDKVYNTESFIKKAKEVHGDLYNYSKSSYSNTNKHITIVCKIHGEYQQNIKSHLHGSHCIKCARQNRTATAGWSRERFKGVSAILYYIRLKKENLYKIGVTSRSVQERFPKEELENMEIVSEEFFQDGRDAFDKELKLLQENRDKKYRGLPVLKSGNTELFVSDIFED